MPAHTIAIAALVFGLILEASALNLYLKARPRGEILPLALIGGVFLLVGGVRLLV